MNEYADARSVKEDPVVQQGFTATDAWQEISRMSQTVSSTPGSIAKDAPLNVSPLFSDGQSASANATTDGKPRLIRLCTYSNPPQCAEVPVKPPQPWIQPDVQPELSEDLFNEIKQRLFEEITNMEGYESMDSHQLSILLDHLQTDIMQQKQLDHLFNDSLLKRLHYYHR